jgi:anionic cell wall polymer biosynthesis LytR-Cps2A-Psr (LCP) family protein
MSFLTVWRKEKWRITALSVFLSVSISACASLFFPGEPLTVAAITPRVDSAVDTVIAARKLDALSLEDVPFGDASTINVLVLGIDSRKEGKERHCDAIHMVSVNVQDWTVLVTSVPRGTYAYIPPGTWADNEYYLANACAFAGLDYGVEQIERIVGVQADYVATVGFSQTLGILRALDMPTTESLQWLRHRQSYSIGDPQRSQNQAVFMKDVALKLLDNGIPDILFHVLYSFVDTDMEYATAKTLFDGLRVHGITNRQDDIVLDMKPHFDVKEIHFDPENAEAQVAALVAKLQGRLSRFDLSNRTLEEIQADLVAYLEAELASGDNISSIVEDELWLQVEEASTREALHYQFVELRARELKASDRDAAIQLIADYILEKQTEGMLVWEQKGRSLLEAFIAKE